MDAIYSASLLVALLAGGGATLAALWTRFAGGRALGSRIARLARAALALALIGGLSTALSIAVHARWGHGEASAEPMAAGAFVAAHPAFLLAAALAALGAGLAIRAGSASKRRR